MRIELVKLLLHCAWGVWRGRLILDETRQSIERIEISLYRRGYCRERMLVK